MAATFAGGVLGASALSGSAIGILALGASGATLLGAFRRRLITAAVTKFVEDRALDENVQPNEHGKRVVQVTEQELSDIVHAVDHRHFVQRLMMPVCVCLIFAFLAGVRR